MKRGIVEAISSDGRGIIRDEKVNFVLGALPGDEVEYEIINEKKRFNECALIHIINYSNKRQRNDNPLGSAYPLYPLEEDYQLELKKEMVVNNLKKIAKLDLDNIAINAVKNDSYRLNKIRLHIKDDKIGLMEFKSNEIYEPDYDILFGDGKLLKSLPMKIKNASYASIRRDSNGYLYIATDGESLIEIDDKIRGIKDINEIRGDNPSYDIIQNSYEVGIDGFFQNSISGAASCLKIIGDEKRGDLLDLYSGVGLISLYVAKNAKSVTGVEINKEAVNFANKNAIKNYGKNNSIKFIAKDTDEFIKDNKRKFDTVIVDPPRSGLTKLTINGIIEIAKDELIYMSCDHATLARDLYILKEYFKIDEIYIVDMFKGTIEVETVALLSKLNTKYHLDIEIGEDELSEIDFSKDATYGEIKKFVLDKYGLKVSSLYIEQVKRKYGLIERENYNISKKENQRVPNCPEEKEKAIEKALKCFGMI